MKEKLYKNCNLNKINLNEFAILNTRSGVWKLDILVTAFKSWSKW